MTCRRRRIRESGHPCETLEVKHTAFFLLALSVSPLIASCQGEDLSSASTTRVAQVDRAEPTPSATSPCVLELLKTNGASATDPNRTNYVCYFDDDSSNFVFALRDDDARYKAQGGVIESFSWTSSSCRLMFTSAGGHFFAIHDVVLNADQTLQSGSLTEGGVARAFGNCYFDLSPHL